MMLPLTHESPGTAEEARGNHDTAFAMHVRVQPAAAVRRATTCAAGGQGWHKRSPARPAQITQRVASMGLISHTLTSAAVRSVHG